MADILYLSRSHVDSMIAYTDACAPEEGCGLLAGVDRKVEITILITNQSHSPVRYNMEPRELVKAFFDIDKLGMELLAIFHSHPNGPSTPSPTDLTGYLYPKARMVILSKETGIWRLKGFKISDGNFQEIELRIE